MHRYSAVEIQIMLEFPIDNVFVAVGDQVGWNSHGYGLCSYKWTCFKFINAGFIHKLSIKKNPLLLP
jgi:hypothetical protein